MQLVDQKVMQEGKRLDSKYQLTEKCISRLPVENRETKYSATYGRYLSTLLWYGDLYL